MNPEQKQIKIKCQKHPKNNIIFIQVNEIQADHTLFYCEKCVNEDFNFKSQNFISLKDLLELEDNKMILYWPPLNNRDLQQQIYQTQEQNETQMQILSKKIIAYFDDLTEKVIANIQQNKKNILKYIQEIHPFESEILEKYQEMSNIDRLNQILWENLENITLMEKESRLFISEFNERKENNSDIFQRIINKNEQLIGAFDFRLLETIKEQIIKDIDKISLLNLNKSIIEKQNIQGMKFIQTLDFTLSKKCVDEMSEAKIERNPENDQITFSISQERKYYSQLHSNKILDRNKKYIFRFKACNKKQERVSLFGFGLIRDDLVNTHWFHSIDLFYHFKIHTYTGLSEQTSQIVNLRGDFHKFKNQLEPELELVICINQGLFQVSDLSDSKLVVVLKQECLNKLSLNQNLKLYILIDQDNELCLTEALEL